MVSTVWSKKTLYWFEWERQKTSNSEHLYQAWFFFFFFQTKTISEVLPAVESHRFIAPWWLKQTHCFSACIVQITGMCVLFYLCPSCCHIQYTAKKIGRFFSSTHLPTKKKNRGKNKTTWMWGGKKRKAVNNEKLKGIIFCIWQKLLENIKLSNMK